MVDQICARSVELQFHRLFFHSYRCHAFVRSPSLVGDLDPDGDAVAVVAGYGHFPAQVNLYILLAAGVGNLQICKVV